MKVYNYVLSQDQIDAAKKVMKRRFFTKAEVTEALEEKGVPIGQQFDFCWFFISDRAADRLLRKAKAEGLISTVPGNKRKWTTNKEKLTERYQLKSIKSDYVVNIDDFKNTCASLSNTLVQLEALETSAVIGVVNNVYFRLSAISKKQAKEENLQVYKQWNILKEKV